MVYTGSDLALGYLQVAQLFYNSLTCADKIMDGQTDRRSINDRQTDKVYYILDGYCYIKSYKRKHRIIELLFY